MLLGAAGGASLLTTAPLVGLDLRLLAGGGQHHDHLAAILARMGFDGGELADLLGDLRQQAHTEFGTGLLTAAEADDALDLVPALEESAHVPHLGGVVVLVDLGPELDLLELRVRLVAPGVARLHGRLVLELAVVHELAHRGARIRGDLDEVETSLLGQSKGVLHADDADLLATGADQAHLGDADPFVDTGLADGYSSLLVRIPWQRERPPLRIASGGLICSYKHADARTRVSTGGMPPARTRPLDRTQVGLLRLRAGDGPRPVNH